jgi:uncharacterized OB-fold protein
MTTPEFPAPVQDLDSAPYWDSLRQHALRLPYCAACGQFFFYPRTICPRCHASDVEWRPASGHGVIYSYTVVRRAFSPAFADDVPYTVAVADLDEGCRIIARVRPEDASRTVIGARVQIDYHDQSDTLTLPMLRIAPSAD